MKYKMFLTQTLVLRLHKPRNDKKVKWDEAVVDNEHMGKKKSKCKYITMVTVKPHPPLIHTGCCIYEKPHNHDDGSDSDSDGDNDCCHEHHVARVNVPRHHDSKTS